MGPGDVMRLNGFLSSRVPSACFALLLFAASSSAAQDHPQSGEAFQAPLRIDLRPVEQPRRQTPERPSALMPMYGSLVVLQGLDIHSTRRGMSSGKTHEANPVMGSVVENGAAFVAVKAAVTAGAIWATERLWKKHPKRAVIFAVLLNAAMAAVVTHNYRIAK
jgi:hypothetical protein